jgi:hypothetical protein
VKNCRLGRHAAAPPKGHAVIAVIPKLKFQGSMSIAALLKRHNSAVASAAVIELCPAVA